MKVLETEFALWLGRRNHPRWRVRQISAAGILARYVGMLPAELVRGKSGGAGEGEAYKVYHPKKAGKFTYSKGKPVFELVGPDGASYVMQAAGALVDPNLTYESLATLGDKLKPAPGWKYRVRNLDNDLAIDYPKGTVVTAVSDDLRNIYNLAPKRDTPVKGREMS